MDFGKFPSNIFLKGKIGKVQSLPIQDEPGDVGATGTCGCDMAVAARLSQILLFLIDIYYCLTCSCHHLT